MFNSFDCSCKPAFSNHSNCSTVRDEVYIAYGFLLNGFPYVRSIFVLWFGEIFLVLMFTLLRKTESKLSTCMAGWITLKSFQWNEYKLGLLQWNSAWECNCTTKNSHRLLSLPLAPDTIETPFRGLYANALYSLICFGMASYKTNISILMTVHCAVLWCDGGCLSSFWTVSHTVDI